MDDRGCFPAKVIGPVDQIVGLPSQSGKHKANFAVRQLQREPVSRRRVLAKWPDGSTVDQEVNCPARGPQSFRNAETKVYEINLGSLLALKRFDQIRDQLIVAGQSELQEIIEGQRALAQRRIDAPICRVLLEQALKQTPRRLHRTGVTAYEGEVNRHGIAPPHE